MTRRFAPAALVSLLALFVVALPAAQEASHADADRAREKIDAIIAIGDEPPHPQGISTRTDLTEAEINAYLRVHGPRVHAQGHCRARDPPRR